MKGKVPLTPAALTGYLQLPQELAERLISTEPIEKYYDVEEEPFARGKYATVRRCRERSSGLQFAAKFLRKRCRSKDNRPEILHEVAVLEACRSSSRVVKLHRVFESTTDMVLLLELASGGELQMLLDADDVPTESQVQTLMKQIMDGILYLHSINIAHLDLKPQNLVLTRKFPDCDVKLCDFGISRYLTQGADVREILGTPDYVAPEVLNYEPISLATDMWSVGVLMYVLLTGCSPFGGETKQETFCNITQCRLDFPDDLFEEISEEAKDLMTKLMVKNPDARLTANDCVKHPWFTMTLEDSSPTPTIPASPNLPRTPVPTKKPAPPEELRTPENNNISVTSFIEEIQVAEIKRNDNQPKVTSLDRVDSFKARANGMQTMPVRPVAKQRLPLNINLNREIDAVTFKYRRVLIDDSDEASPPSSISSGYTSGSISSDNSICDTNSDTVSEMSIDSSSDRSSIISLDDSLDFSLNKGMLRHFSSCHNLWALKNQKPSTRSLPKECQGSFVRALSQLSRPAEVKESAFPIRTPKLAIFNNNRPLPQISPGRKYIGVESMRERNGNIVVIREVKAVNRSGYAKTCEVKCESVQARIRKFQMAPSPGKNDVF